MQKPRRHRVFSGVIALFVPLVACGPDIPEECGENVAQVTSIDFAGPSVIATTPEFDFEGYDVTAEIEKTDGDQPATLCLAVRDDDPWTKGPWAVDDVLDANVIVFPARTTRRTLPGHFSLFAKDDDEVCGTGALPGDSTVEGCSGEREAEVYLQPINSEGAESPRHAIRVE